MKCKQAPVLIVGGGPAGITTALTLAARGIYFIIVDQEEFAKPKPGEAIPPNAIPLFKQLGYEPLLKHPGHAVYHGNKSIWGTGKVEEKVFLFEPNSKGYLLNRQLFETQLRELSISRGADWIFGNLQSVHIVKNKVLACIQTKSGPVNISANYVVDASGKKASVCRHLGIRAQAFDQLAAITFRCTIPIQPQSYIHIESFESGWIYFAPAAGNSISVMLFTDIGLLPAPAKRKIFIVDILKRSYFLTELLKNNIDAKQILHLKIRPANTSRLPVPFGKNWIAIGDAAYSFDPVSSYGITSAIAAGYYGGQALADKLENKEEALDLYRYIMENAFGAYLKRYNEHYFLEQRWPENLFWKQRHKIFENGAGR